LAERVFRADVVVRQRWDSRLGDAVECRAIAVDQRAPFGVVVLGRAVVRGKSLRVPATSAVAITLIYTAAFTRVGR
jgi:uncharacterized membrane protein